MSLHKHIALIGMPASGKTVVGDILARAMQRPFYDTDELIKKTTGQSIADIFHYRGEPYFRHKEAVTVASLINLKHAVIATGGGAVLDKHTNKLLQSQTVIYLDTPIETLWERLEFDTTRPHLNTDKKYETLEKSYKTRKPIYEVLASRIVNAQDKTPTDIATEILSAFNINWTLTSGSLCIESTL